MAEALEYDAAVVGGGVMGYSAALELAMHGFRTVLFEQFPSPHTRGSSTGQSRITRIANTQVSGMTGIMVDALDRWKEIEKEVKRQLLVPSPMLCVGTGKPMAALRTSILAAGGTPEEATPLELNRRYGYNFPPDFETFFDTQSAVMLADQCVLALKELLERHGGAIKDRWPVEELEPQDSGKVLLRGPGGQSALVGRVAVCAGPWAGSLLQRLGLSLPLQPQRVNVWYWRKRSEKDTCHLFLFKSEKETEFYGLPSVEYPGLVKICAHGGTPCDPDDRDRVATDHTLDQVTEFVTQTFPFLEPTPSVRETCMYTTTPDEEMILDLLPGHKNIAFACGFSGTGFKIGPVVGRLLRQLITEQPLDHDISRFSASRFST